MPALLRRSIVLNTQKLFARITNTGEERTKYFFLVTKPNGVEIIRSCRRNWRLLKSLNYHRGDSSDRDWNKKIMSKQVIFFSKEFERLCRHFYVHWSSPRRVYRSNYFLFRSAVRHDEKYYFRYKIVYFLFLISISNGLARSLARGKLVTDCYRKNVRRK